MPSRERLPPWHERQRLPNGREVLIRPIRPEDAEPLRGGFALLGPEEVRQRFLFSMPELTPEMAQRFARINPRNEFALVAAEPLPPGEALVGAVARVIVDPSGRDGEFAILVSDTPPDLDCGDIGFRNFTVLWNVPDPDPHGFDGDRDGIGCET